MVFRVLASAALLVCCSAPAAAQQSVTLEFDGGQVTLIARNAPVRAVLAEWARLGGATIVNGDRVAGPPITLELTGVPERQALDTLLRNVAGYMLAPRRAGSAGASSFDRILILPTSAAPRNPPPTVAQPRPVMPRPPMVVTPPEGFPVDVMDGFPENMTGADDPDAAEAPVPIVRPGMPRLGAPPRMVMPPQPLGAEPQIVTFDGSEEQPGEQPAQDTGTAPSPTNPFGVPFGSSARPGVVTPVPQPADGVQ